MRRSLGLGFAVLLTSPLAAQGRGFDVEIAAGVAVAARSLEPSGGAGRLVRIGVISRSAGRPVRYRLDAEAFSVPRDPDSRSDQGADGVRLAGVNYSALFGPALARFAPYAIGGVGFSVVQDRSPDSWPGLFASVRIGAGVRGQIGEAALSAEIATVRPLNRVGLGLYVPIALGVRF